MTEIEGHCKTMVIDGKHLTSLQRRTLKTGVKAYTERATYAGDFPPVLFIELTRNCIARCRYCRKKWVNDPKYDMSGETFQVILRDYAPHAALIDLRSYGESLMLKNFRRYVEQLGNACRNLRITTTLGCGDDDALKALVDHDVFVSVSFDAADKRLYEHYRCGISYDTVVRNLKFVSELMLKTYGELRGRMRIGIAPLYRDNLDFVDGVIEFAHCLHIPEIRILQLASDWYDPNTLYFHKRKLLHVLQKAIKKAAGYGIELQFGSPLITQLKLAEKTCDVCIKPWLYASIMYNGTVRYCDWQIELEKKRDDFGTVHDGAENVWNGEVARRVREAHVRSRSFPPACVTCYRIGRYSDHEHDIDRIFRKWLVTGEDIRERIDTLLTGKLLRRADYDV